MKADYITYGKINLAVNNYCFTKISNATPELLKGFKGVAGYMEYTNGVSRLNNF
uniref:AlNc14C190G8425 protein n=1 Tax=Albugo laibachii Nc14 TaxID=890382 RepID=F0WPT3_9STRA|nr:AlNc14C190G8425 [Albugo laibachii Nc14]|eukprot:CCA23334.1 AlNc14C190G8425 [Albugo laibachii Nc14]